MEELSFHPASEIFDLLSGADFDALVEDIRKNGLINHIWLHPDGSILDGRNRYRACVASGTVPRFQTWDGEGSAAEFVWSLNFTRRHLDGGARQMAAGRFAIELEREARQRRGTRTDLSNRSTSGPDGPEVDASNEEDTFGRSAEAAADKFGISKNSVKRAVSVAKKGAAELAEAVERDEVSVTAAADVATLPQEQQREIVAKGPAEILAAAKAIRAEKAKQRKAENEALKAANPVVIPAGKHTVIIIDPPWEMQKIERDARPNQVDFDYPTMTEEELAAFEVGKMAADDCHLFCWTTHKHLPMSLRLIEAWGFRYVLTMTWHKSGGFQPVGLPQYNCEFAVYARKGSPEFVDTKAFPCCFYGERREHSRKPDEFYDMIARVTDGPRIDVFSRERRDGFEQFGNETEKFGTAA